MKLPGSPLKPVDSTSSSSADTVKPCPAFCVKMALMRSTLSREARRGMRPPNARRQHGVVAPVIQLEGPTLSLHCCELLQGGALLLKEAHCYDAAALTNRNCPHACYLKHAPICRIGCVWTPLKLTLSRAHERVLSLEGKTQAKHCDRESRILQAQHTGEIA